MEIRGCSLGSVHTWPWSPRAPQGLQEDRLTPILPESSLKWGLCRVHLLFLICSPRPAPQMVTGEQGTGQRGRQRPWAGTRSPGGSEHTWTGPPQGTWLSAPPCSACPGTNSGQLASLSSFPDISQASEDTKPPSCYPFIINLISFRAAWSHFLLTQGTHDMATDPLPS